MARTATRRDKPMSKATRMIPTKVPISMRDYMCNIQSLKSKRMNRTDGWTETKQMQANQVESRRAKA